MRRAIFISMALGLWRDRAAFALTFALPPIIFTIFAAVFSAAAGGDIAIRLGVAAPGDEVSRELVAGLQASDLIAELIESPDAENLKARVKSGAIDAAIEITRDTEESPPAFTIYYDAAKASAATMAEAALAALAPPGLTAGADEDDPAIAMAPAEKIAVTGGAAATPMAAYYAAGVGMLFLFLSGFQSALTVIEERDAGVMERIASGPYGLRPMIDGKFAFLTLQGAAQLTVILLAAALIFKTPLSQSPIQLAITIIAAAISAAGIALAVIGCCRSRSQAHALGAVLALIMGALGGSMAPRFLMAPEIRTIGAFTPNAWGIDAFAVSLWRGGALDLLWTPWALLAGSGLAGLLIAYLIMPRTLRAG